METKKVTLTLPLSAAKALEDAAYRAKTTKSKLMAGLLERQASGGQSFPMLE